MAAYTCKALQELDQDNVYAPRIRHSHASGGVVSLLIRCEAPLLCFFSRLVLLEFSEATRDSVWPMQISVLCFYAVCSWADRMRASDSHANYLIRMRTTVFVFELPD